MLFGDWLDEHGHHIRPVDDPALVEIDPGAPWHRIDPNSVLDNVAVYGSPDLSRGDFSPTVVVSLCAVEPALDAALLLERLADSALELPGWRRIAWSTLAADDARTSELVGEFRAGGHHLASTTVATTWADGGAAMLYQVVVTTFADQIEHHAPALRNAAPRRGPAPEGIQPAEGAGPAAARPAPLPAQTPDGPLNI